MADATSFTHLALQLASRGERIPLTDETSRLLPGLIWSGHFQHVNHAKDEPYLFATLTDKGRELLAWLEE